MKKKQYKSCLNARGPVVELSCEVYEKLGEWSYLLFKVGNMTKVINRWIYLLRLIFHTLLSADGG